MKTLDCHEAEELMVYDLDGGLPPESERILASHLAECPACKALKEEYVSLFSALKSDVAQDPGEEFWKEQQESLKEIQNRVIPFRFRVSRTTGMLLAAILALVVIGMGIFYHVRDSAQGNPSETLIVAQELEHLYGATPDEMVILAGDQSMIWTDITKVSKSDDIANLDWFDVEDEPNHFWM
jgi:predicted anti-sigma-YlaC factor YlaD